MNTEEIEIKLPWLVLQPLPTALALGPGLDSGQLQLAFRRLIADTGVKAVNVSNGSAAALACDG